MTYGFNSIARQCDLQLVFIPILAGLIPLIYLLFRYQIGKLAAILFIFIYFRMSEIINPLLVYLRPDATMGSLKPFPIIELLIYIIITMLALDLFLKRQPFYWHKALTILTTFFILLTGGMLIIYSDKVYLAWKALTSLFIIMITISQVINRRSDFIAIQRVAILSGIYLSILALTSNIGIGEDAKRMVLATGSILRDPNDFALILLFPLSLCCAIMTQQNQGFVNNTLTLIGLPLLSYSIYLTHSRGSILGAASIVCIIASQKIKSKFFLLSLYASILAISFFLITNMRMPDFASTGILDASASGRLTAWRAAISMALDNPLFGVGISSFYDAFHSRMPTWVGKL